KKKFWNRATSPITGITDAYEPTSEPHIENRGTPSSEATPPKPKVPRLNIPARPESKFGPPRSQHAMTTTSNGARREVPGFDQGAEIDVPAGSFWDTATTAMASHEDVRAQFSASLDPGAWKYSSLAIAGVNLPVAVTASTDSEVAAILSYPAQEPPKKSLALSVELPRCPWPFPTNPNSPPRITSIENHDAAPIPIPKAHGISPPKVSINDSAEHTTREVRNNRRLMVVGSISALSITGGFLRSGRRRRIRL
ncbi:hypothetical protein RUND412_009759, partial [Rhizina undulata]